MAFVRIGPRIINSNHLALIERGAGGIATLTFTGGVTLVLPAPEAGLFLRWLRDQEVIVRPQPPAGP